MGVPKFYRWISERYPKINEIISDSALLPEFDHLYLDMNGIIHGCSHPADRDISDVVSEKDMMLGIMHYLDRIITQIVKPKVSLYMAIDGVAPRAKLNQQRSRRFGAAQTMAEATKEMAASSESGSKPHVFDSNCITPGTEFMARVSEHIKYFIRKKLKEDPQWRKLQVIFSGHELPGEGEHKIMEHIRRMKNQPGYRPNTRHCIYGQDADLIMLALVTHEPHFTILREVVDFGFGGRRNDNALKQVKKFTKESDFQLLHLSVLREYLSIEFCKDFPDMSLEHSIDDFVFMTFLVGNDFLPHLNTLDISEGAFDLLFRIYKEQRSGWGKGQYLTDGGEVVNAARLESFLQKIGEVEAETLEEREKNDAVYLKKRRRWDKRDGKAAGPSDQELAEAESGKQTEFEAMLRTVTSKPDAKYVDGWKPAQAGEKDFKGRYYFEKMKMTPIDIDAHHALRKAYIEGLLWCMAYYYKGCISWGWFYPYHYGPMLSDLRNLPQMFKEIKFEKGAPLTPFQQLMGCLPPASSSLVPKPYRTLMTSPESPILAFYPLDFKVDMNGKKNPWEGVNLLPFIDAELLKETITKYCPPSILTPAETKRNRIGTVYSYQYDETCNETVPSPNRGIGLTDIIKCHSRVTETTEAETGEISFRPELLPGTKLPYPGFPSLNVLPIASTELTPIGLNCFGMPSKYPNTILRMHQMPKVQSVQVLAGNVLGKSLFVNWPMMHEGRVVCISDESCEVRLVKGKPTTKQYNQKESETWLADAETIKQGYLHGTGIPGSGGVEIGEITVRIKVLPLQGMKTNPANGSTKKVFGKEEADVPLQLALWQSPAPDPRFIERGPMQLQDRFPAASQVVLTKGKYRGCSGAVVGVADAQKVAVKVNVMPPEVPFGLAVANSVLETYISSADAARILKIHPGLFGRITSNLFVGPGRYDLGLNLKSNDGYCVAGYTRKRVDANKKNASKKSVWNSGDSVLIVGSSRAPNGLDDRNGNGSQERIIWEYTSKAIRLVNEYRQKFPQFFLAISQFPNEKSYDATRIFGPNGNNWLPVIREWLNNVESAKLPRTPVSTEMMSHEATAAVEKASDVRSLALKKKGFPTPSLIKIPGSALYAENSVGATDVILAGDHNNNERPALGDRVVNLCATGIPFGARGTIISIHQDTTGCVEVVMDEEFVGGTTLQGHCSNFRGKLCMWSHLLKISMDGDDDNNKNAANKAAAKGQGKSAVGKIMSEIQRDTKKHAETAQKALPMGQQVAAHRPLSTGRAGSAKRTASAGRTRSDSRSKQAGWKEAQGPPEKGIGFKGARKDAAGKSGIARWRKLILNKGKQTPSKQRPSPSKPSVVAQNKAIELKAMLGMSGGGAVAAEAAATAPPPPPTAPVPAPAPTVQDVTQGLKAMLGVGTGPAATTAPSAAATAPAATQMQTADTPPSTNEASAGLKSLLGVTTSSAPAPLATNDGFPPPPPPPPPSALPIPQMHMQMQTQMQMPMQMAAHGMMMPIPPHQQPMAPPVPANPKTAADQVLKMLASKGPQMSAMHNPSSSFNFTYTEEGKEPPAQPKAPPQQQQQQHRHHQHQPGMMYPPTMMPNGAPVGMMPFMPMPHMAMGHPPMPPMPMPSAVFGVPLPPGAQPNGNPPQQQQQQQQASAPSQDVDKDAADSKTK